MSHESPPVSTISVTYEDLSTSSNRLDRDGRRSPRGTREPNETRGVPLPSPLLQRQTSPRSNHNKKASKQFTAHEYASAIDVHANRNIGDSLYPGHHFRNLAAFLRRPYEQDGPSLALPTKRSRVLPDDESFVNVIDFRNGQQSHPVRTIRQLDNIVSAVPSDSNQGQILFLRGYQSPDWLNAVGSKCRLDPEFLQRHLSFAPNGSHMSQGRTDYFALPSLPSTYSNLVRLRISTLGSRTLSRTLTPMQAQKQVAQLREEGQDMMFKFTDHVFKHDEEYLAPGDSIVRDFSVHDVEHFSFEQEISITISHFDGRWIVICWLDIGRDLEMGQDGPWSGDVFKKNLIAMTNYPTIQHKPLVALKDHVHNSGAVGKSTDKLEKQTSAGTGRRQSASILHVDHGLQVDADAALYDPFHAVSSIFRFVAFAESQFLNMMDLKIRRELDRDILKDNHRPDLSNLIYTKQILERHIQNIKEPLAFMEGMTQSVWPKLPRRNDIPSSLRDKCEGIKEQILRDYKYLLDKAQYLSSECDRRTNIVMNEVMVRESQKAIEEAERVTKLTTLAFFFIPLSFTSTFFGMNVTQLNSGSTIGLWVWVAVSVPILLVSLVFLKWDMSDFRNLFTERTRWKAKKRQNQV